MNRFEIFPQCASGWVNYHDRYEYNRPVYKPAMRPLRHNRLFGCIPMARQRAETAYGYTQSPYWQFADYHLS